MNPHSNLVPGAGQDLYRVGANSLAEPRYGSAGRLSPARGRAALSDQATEQLSLGPRTLRTEPEQGGRRRA